MTLQDFLGDQQVIDAVLRNLEVIGEAARHVPEPIRQRYEDIPWAQITGMRNVLAHEYFGVRLPLIWRTVRVSLPQVKPAFARLLENEPDDAV